MKKRTFPPAKAERKWRLEALTIEEGYYSTVVHKPNLSEALLGLLNERDSGKHGKILISEIIQGKPQTFVLMNNKFRIP
jgi:hypothetical protein